MSVFLCARANHLWPYIRTETPQILLKQSALLAGIRSVSLPDISRFPPLAGSVSEISLSISKNIRIRVMAVALLLTSHHIPEWVVLAIWGSSELSQSVRSVWKRLTASDYATLSVWKKRTTNQTSQQNAKQKSTPEMYITRSQD